MNLKEIRSKLKLTQADTSRLAGVTVTTWCRWETGKHQPQNSQRLNLLDAAAAAKPCRLSPNWTLAKGVTLDHINKCPRCMLAWISGGISNG